MIIVTLERLWQLFNKHPSFTKMNLLYLRVHIVLDVKKAIAWFDNVPLFGFILLKGKCRQCGIKISPRYFLVELINGLLWVGLFLGFGINQSCRWSCSLFNFTCNYDD